MFQDKISIIPGQEEPNEAGSAPERSLHHLARQSYSIEGEAAEENPTNAESFRKLGNKFVIKHFHKVGLESSAHLVKASAISCATVSRYIAVLIQKNRVLKY